MSRGSLKLFILFFAVLISIISVGLVLYAKSQPELPSVQRSQTQMQNSRLEKYIVKEYQGMVAVYYTKQPSVPKYITEIAVETLPQADREHLKQGIYVNADVDLTALLEDYQ